MRILVLLLLALMAGCHGSKGLLRHQPKVLDAYTQKFVPGEASGKGIIFKIALSNTLDSLETLNIDKLIINGEQMPVSTKIEKDSIFIESSMFYQNPQKDPRGYGNQKEYEQAPLFNAPNHKGQILYTIGDHKDTLVIENFSAREMQFYP